jgi:hypothetical protein
MSRWLFHSQKDSNIIYADNIRADFVDRLALYWDPNRPIYDFMEHLPESTLMAWSNLLLPVTANIGVRYGPDSLSEWL